jgi:hypothetical protein
MIVPFKYRLGVELANDAVKVVLIEIEQTVCRVLHAEEGHIDAGELDTTSDFGSVLQPIRKNLPKDHGPVAASIVIPAERVIEFSIQIPKDLTVHRDEWERWEVSTHLIGDMSDYLYESWHLKDSTCGKYQIRMIRATRRRFIDKFAEQAKALDVFVDEVYFPQSIWGRIISGYCMNGRSDAADCVFIGRESAYLVRTMNGKVTEMLPAQLPSRDVRGRFAETIETLLSWNMAGRRDSQQRIVIDSGDHADLKAELKSRLRFSEFESKPLMDLLHGTIDIPERFLLPLSALGAI